MVRISASIFMVALVAVLASAAAPAHAMAEADAEIKGRDGKRMGHGLMIRASSGVLLKVR